ncbi:MAG: hypothetical protein HYZ65_06840 [Burkholderiales bacterium]|nr:hypothetical protein [Burkholderiales bacterium]
MSKRYHYLPLSKVAVGMVLADDLLDKLGHVLLPAGTTLSEHMLRSIAQHDIRQLSVEADGPSQAEQDEEKQRQLVRLEQLFRQPPYDEPTATLLAYLRTYRLGAYK